MSKVPVPPSVPSTFPQFHPQPPQVELAVQPEQSTKVCVALPDAESTPPVDEPAPHLVDCPSQGNLSLADIRSLIADAKAEQAAQAAAQGAVRTQLEEAKCQMRAVVNRVASERGDLARYDAARAEYESLPEGKERRKPFVWKGGQVDPPLTLTQIAELEAKIDWWRERIALLEQRLPEQPRLPADRLSTQEQRQLYLANRAKPKSSPFAAFLPRLHELRAEAEKEVQQLERLSEDVQQALRSERDVDALLQLRANADSLPLRLVCARIAAAMVDVVLAYCTDLRQAIGGYAHLGKAEARLAELHDEKVSLVCGKTVRSVQHIASTWQER